MVGKARRREFLNPVVTVGFVAVQIPRVMAMVRAMVAGSKTGKR